MPKRGLSKHVGGTRNELYRAAKYHWEFKRRNKAYRSWWQDGVKAEVKPEGWDEMFDPDTPFDELTRQAVDKALSGIQHPKLQMFFSETPHRSLMSSILGYHFMQGMLPKGVEIEPDLSPGCMRITVDFSKINSISTLREYVSSVIQEVYDINIKVGTIKNIKRGPRGKSLYLNKDFERILDAGDMYRDGKKYRQIADKKFSSDNDREGARIKAFNLVKEYKKLVSGGYQDIIFP